MTSLQGPLDIEARWRAGVLFTSLCQLAHIGQVEKLGAVDDLSRMSRIPSIAAMKRPIPVHNVDAMDGNQYPTRNVSDTGGKPPYLMDAALDETAGERTRTNSVDSPATAS